MKLGIVIFTFFAVIKSNLSSKPLRYTAILFTQWTRTEPNETCDENMNNCKYYIEICWSWRDHNQSRCSLGWLNRSYTYTMKPTQTRTFKLYHYFSRSIYNPLRTLVDMWSDRMTILEFNIYQEGKGPNPVERLNISKRSPYPIRDINKLHDDTYNITGSKFRVYGAIYMWCDDNCVPPTTVPTTLPPTLPTIAPSTPPSKPYSKPTSPKSFRNFGLIFTQWTRTEPNETCNANMNNCKYYIEICWSWRDHNQSRCSLGWLKRSYMYTMKPAQTRRFLLYDYFSRNIFNPLWTLADMWSDRMTIVEFNIYQEGKGPNPVERLNISKRLPYPIRDENKLYDNPYNITGSKFRVYGAIFMWCDVNCVPSTSLPSIPLTTQSYRPSFTSSTINTLPTHYKIVVKQSTTKTEQLITNTIYTKSPTDNVSKKFTTMKIDKNFTEKNTIPTQLVTTHKILQIHTTATISVKIPVDQTTQQPSPSPTKEHKEANEIHTTSAISVKIPVDRTTQQPSPSPTKEDKEANEIHTTSAISVKILVDQTIQQPSASPTKGDKEANIPLTTQSYRPSFTSSTINTLPTHSKIVPKQSTTKTKQLISNTINTKSPTDQHDNKSSHLSKWKVLAVILTSLCGVMVLLALARWWLKRKSQSADIKTTDQQHNAKNTEIFKYKMVFGNDADNLNSKQDDKMINMLDLMETKSNF